MALSRTWEEHELAPEVRRIFPEVRTTLDLPFVPTLFKLLAGAPDYLRVMWDDLSYVARSREFQAASLAMEEFARSLAISGGWRFSDQQRLLAAQKFSFNDIEQLGAIAATFARTAARLTLFTRLAQKGYSGGQPGRVSNGRQASALSRMITLHVPAESDASLRAWLIYGDIRRTLNSSTVASIFRVLAPFPSYLASVWLDSKKMLVDPGFVRAREQVGKRSQALLLGLPVKDHRNSLKQLDPKQWREIEDTVDSFARQAPSLAMLTAVWQRSFSRSGRTLAA